MTIRRLLEGHLTTTHVAAFARSGWMIKFKGDTYRIPKPQLPREKRLLYRLVDKRPRRRP